MVRNIWKIDLFEVVGKTGAICKICREVGAKKHKYKISDGSFKSLISHTKQHAEYETKLAKLEDRSDEAFVMERFVVQPSGGMSSLDKKVINYIAENCVSFNCVESRSFISLFSSSNSTEKLKNRRHYSDTVLPRAYRAVVNPMKAKIKILESIFFTTDWDSKPFCIQSPTAVMVEKKMAATKRLAAENLAASSHLILSAASNGSSIYEIESMPKDSDIKRMINNARKAKGASEVDKILMGMTLSRNFTTIIRGERFLLWDSREVDLKKPVILLFASSFGLQLLEKYKRWSMDGTFYSAPKGFEQLYTVSVFKKSQRCHVSLCCYQTNPKSLTLRRSMQSLEIIRCLNQKHLWQILSKLMQKL